MATTALTVTLTSKTAIHINSYQSEFLFIQDNISNDYRKVFHHFLHQWMKI